MQAIDIMWVFLGGGIGSVLRWGVGLAVEARIRMRFRLGTYLVNVTGAFVIAYLSTAFMIDWHHRYGDMMSSFVLTGILGGYTTFSSMQLDTVQMAEDGRHGLALVYIVSSIGSGLLAVAAGVALASI
ncbi:CrcB family protein [Acuticoccus sp. M5D2P5]|uniref:fluoride efflux transporter FluC n=1 Tax=Acuticoccus kalidii TaxID=2910977 RepID=UPI001F15E541|nr:CrcB family protein [Acuticoccus kalidii]MCF3932043.1 CrcB family protein [Acuticoccus kalidii]